MHSFTYRAAALTLSCAMLIAMSGCGAAVPAATTPTEVPSIVLTASPPTRGSLALSTSFVGTVQPEQVVAVIPKLGGTVEKINVTVGQQVKKGDLLVTFDSEDVMPSYNQAEASYNSAKAQTDQMTGSGYKSSLANLDSAYDQAFDSYEEAKYQVDKLESQRKNLPGGIADKRAELATETDPEKRAALQMEIGQMEDTLQGLPAAISAAESGMEMSRKYFNNARSSYNAMKTEGEVELQNVADATLKQAEAGLNLAKQQLDNTKLYAPIDGVVESIAVTELNAASPSAPALVLANKSALAVTFDVSSAAVMHMKAGDSVRVEKGAVTYPATITEVNTIVNTQTGLFTVKAAMDTTAPELLTGVMVKVSADTEKTENAIMVAQDSLYYDNGKPYVYLAVDDGAGGLVAKKTFVETGISNPKETEILSGVTDTDMVITSWHPNLLDGAAMTLATEEPAVEPAAPSSASASQEG